MGKIIENLRQELVNNADEKTRLSAERYFKEGVKIYGLKSAEVSGISKEHYKAIEDKSKLHIFSLCEKLWQSGYMEESFIACNWSYNVRKQFEPDDFDIFEKWAREDTLVKRVFCVFNHKKYFYILNHGARAIPVQNFKWLKNK